MSKHILQPLATAALLSTFFIQFAHAQNTSPYWSLAGNNNATATTAKLGTTNAYPLRLTTNNTTRLYITSTGNIGIGTTAPAQRLHVEGTSNQVIFVSTSALGTTSGSGMIGYVKATPTATGQRLGYYHLGSRGGAQNNYNAVGMTGFAGGAWSSTSRPAYLTFETTPTGSINKVERVRIDPNGNVGIGVANPELPLEVAGRMRLRSAGGGTAGLWLNNLANSNAIGFVGAANDNHIGLWGNTNAGWGLVMNTTTGNVGIGKPTPVHQLDVNSATTGRVISGESTSEGYSDRIGVYGRSYNAPGFGYGVQGNGGFIGVDGIGTTGGYTGPTYGVQGYASGTAGLRIGVRGAASGGTTTYGVYGSAGGGSFTAAGYFSGNVHATSFITTSDRMFKQDIKLVEHGLEQVLKLRPTTYTFKAAEYKGMHLPEGKQLGLIADEVKEVFPELVEQAVHPAEYDKDDRTKVIHPEVKYEGVNYQGLIPVLIASVQELAEKNKEIDALKKEMTDLRQMVLELKSGRTSTVTSNAYLEQNTPNPVVGSTTIRYQVPTTAASVVLALTNVKGQVVKTQTLTGRGSGQVSLNTAALAAGTYNYTLHVDGRQADTKRLIITK